MTLVAGVDSSTQSVKVVVCELETGAVVRSARASHPDGTEVSAEAWWTAYQQATADPGAAGRGGGAGRRWSATRHGHPGRSASSGP